MSQVDEFLSCGHKKAASKACKLLLRFTVVLSVVFVPQMST